MCAKNKIRVAKKNLEGVGVIFGSSLDGRGETSRVFRTKAGRVVKLTFEPHEARIAIWQIAAKNAGLPIVFNVVGVHSQHDYKWEYCFAILREEVSDVVVSNNLAVDLALRNTSVEKHVFSEDQALLNEAKDLQQSLKPILPSVGADFRCQNLGRVSCRLVLRDFGSCRIREGSAGKPFEDWIGWMSGSFTTDPPDVFRAGEFGDQ